MARQKITPCLWFDGKAKEAAEFYASIVPDSSITGVRPGPDGEALVVEFRLAGVDFLGLNGGPHFTFNEAISLSIDCRSQAEVVPSVLPELLADPDRAKAARVMEAMMGMTRLDIRGLEDAANAPSRGRDEG
jgi:predicted 3-demethylubiquinone-9 3-methyltransferase (glyoxalase superfamily)